MKVISDKENYLSRTNPFQTCGIGGKRGKKRF